jgi:hypothetical protein
MPSAGEPYQDHAGALPIAGQWVAPQYVDLMGARSREGQLVVLQLVDHMVVPHIVAHTAEPQCAGPTAAVPIMVGVTDPIMEPVRLQRGSQLGRLPVPLRLQPIATIRLTATRHRIIIRHPGRDL